jgi:hypothetical protein
LLGYAFEIVHRDSFVLLEDVLKRKNLLFEEDLVADEARKLIGCFDSHLRASLDIAECGRKFLLGNIAGRDVCKLRHDRIASLLKPRFLEASSDQENTIIVIRAVSRADIVAKT